MTHDELLALLAGSTVSDWHVIHCAGGSSGGPSYLDEWGDEHPNTHYTRAVWKADLALGLAWGMSFPGDQRTFGWAVWPDKSAYPSLLDVFWNGMLVHREHGVVVDGGRAILPWPHAELIHGVGTYGVEHIADSVTERAADLWRLRSALEHQGRADEYDRYLETSGLVVIPDSGGDTG